MTIDYAQPHPPRKPEMRRHGDTIEITLEPLPPSAARSIGIGGAAAAAAGGGATRRLLIRDGYLHYSGGSIEVHRLRAVTVRRSRWLPGPVELLAWPKIGLKTRARMRARTLDEQNVRLAPDEQPIPILYGTAQDDFGWLAMALRRVCHLPEISPGVIER